MCEMLIPGDAGHKTRLGCGWCVWGTNKRCSITTKGVQAGNTSHSVDTLSLMKFACADCSHVCGAFVEAE